MAGLLCPLPALVPIGRDERGLVLLDLEAAGVTSLVGAPEDVAPVMAWIVTELALSSWPDYLHVTLVGFGDRLASLDPERLDVVATLDDARLGASAAQVTAPHCVGDDPVLRSRITSGGVEATMPEVLVLPGAPDEPLCQLMGTMPTRKRTTLSVLVAGNCPEAHVSVLVRADRTVDVPILGLTLHANRLEDQTAALLLELLDSARDLTDVPLVIRH